MNEFKTDFRETTYESPIAGYSTERPEPKGKQYMPKIVEEAWKEEAMKWQNTIKQNDNAEKNFGRLVENL